MDEEGEICRVCRCEGTFEQPLFHPCKCSGSIKYVHQECLLEWLGHSKKKYCELCKHPFVFTPIYDPKMPRLLPPPLFFKRAFSHILLFLRTWMRAMLAALVWLILLPYITVWVWRFYFWSGERMAFGLNGQEMPVRNSTRSIFGGFMVNMNKTIDDSGRNMTALDGNETIPIITNSTMHPFVVFLETIIEVGLNLTQAVRSTQSLEEPDERGKLVKAYAVMVARFFIDCFEGQVITCVVVIVFVAAFLLREWIIQNTPAELEGAIEGEEEVAGRVQRIEPAVPVLGQQQQEQDQRLPRVAPDPPQLPMTHHQPQDDIPNQNFFHDLIPQPTVSTETTEKLDVWSTDDYMVSNSVDHFPNFEDHLGDQPESSSSHLHPKRPIAKLRPPSTMRGKERRSSRASSSSSLSSQPDLPSDQPSELQETHLRLKGLQRSLNENYGYYGVLAREMRADSVDPTDTDLDFVNNSETPNDEGTSNLDDDGWNNSLDGDYNYSSLARETEKGSEAKGKGKISYSIPGIPAKDPIRRRSLNLRTQQNFSSDSKKYPPSLREGEATELGSSEFDAAKPFDLNDDPTESTHHAQPQRRFSVENINSDSSTSNDEYKSIFNFQEAINDTTLFSNRGQPHDQREEPRVVQQPRYIDFPRPAQQNAVAIREAVAVPELQQPQQPQQALPIPPQPGEAIRAAAGIAPQQLQQQQPRNANEEDQFDDDEALGDDLDGVLEAIGMRGSLWMLLQNFALMALLIALCLAVAVWIPFFLGKSILVMNPMEAIRLPVAILRLITDPFVDLMLDWVFPIIWNRVSQILMWSIDKIGLDAGKMILVWDEVEKTAIYIMGFLMESFVNLKQGATGLVNSHTINGDQLNITTEAIDHLVTPITSTGWQLPGLTLVNLDESGDMFIHSWNVIIDTAKVVWNSFAYGDSVTERVMCVLVGYAVLVFMGTWYLARTQNAYGRTVGKAVQQAIRQQGIILKVAFFVAIELVVFPIVCGILLDLSTLPLFPHETLLGAIVSRWRFHLDHPLTSIFIHWFLGTGFMFHFAVFVAMCRDIARKGVMWFIRDPNDPQFHPIKEILEREVWTQLRKIAASGVMYSCMIAIGIGSVVYGVYFAGILPLNWNFTEPLSDFPIDLLVFHIIIPITVNWAKPKRFVKSLFKNWWELTCRQLRLTSFMLGKRPPDEEGTFIYKTWLAFFTAKLPEVTEELALGAGNPDDDVIFMKDGGFLKVPNADGVPVVPGRRMLVPVDEQGEPLDPEERRVGHPAETEGGESATQVVYIPPNFWPRVFIFLFMMWFCGSLFTCSVTFLPLVVGRWLFRTFIISTRSVHDIYTFFLGLYVVWSFFLFAEWSIRKMEVWKQNGWNFNIQSFVSKLKEVFLMTVKWAFLILSFGVILPLLLALIVELYVILPLKSSATEVPTIYFPQDWALGIVYMKILYRCVIMLPENRWSRALDEVTANGVWNPNMKAAVNQILIPVGCGSLLILIFPAVTVVLVMYGMGVTPQTSHIQLLRYAYPLVLALILLWYALQQLILLLKSWTQAVRDEEYLVGQRLHNMGEPLVEQAENIIEG